MAAMNAAANRAAVAGVVPSRSTAAPMAAAVTTSHGTTFGGGNFDVRGAYRNMPTASTAALHRCVVTLPSTAGITATYTLFFTLRCHAAGITATYPPFFY